MESGYPSTFSLESLGSTTSSASSLLLFRAAGPTALAQGIWPAALALFLSVSTSILVFPFFPYVPSSGYFGDALPQVPSAACLPFLEFTLHLLCAALFASNLLSVLGVIYQRMLDNKKVMVHVRLKDAVQQLLQHATADSVSILTL